MTYNKELATSLTNDLAYLHDNCDVLDRGDLQVQLGALYEAALQIALNLGADPAEFGDTEEEYGDYDAVPMPGGSFTTNY